MVTRVAREIRQHPRRELLYLFLRDHSRLSGSDVEGLFEFIYSYLVNAFKGELAEVMSRLVIRAFVAERVKAGDLPSAAVVIPGSEITSWRNAQGRVERTWQKSADALVAVRRPNEEGGGWAFLGVVEIKSYRESLRRMFAQIEQHVDRIRLGVQISSALVDPTTSGFVDRADRPTWLPLASPQRPGRVLQLAIRPRAPSRDAQALRPWSGQQECWVDELPCTVGHLHEAAYLLTAWYIAQAGPDVFLPVGEVAGPGDPRIVNPWPERSADSAAANMLKLAMYETSLRENIVTGFESRKPERRSDMVFSRLYNSVCYGPAFARSDRLLTPEDYRREWAATADGSGCQQEPIAAPAADANEALLADAHHLFAIARLVEAREKLEQLPAAELSTSQQRRARWLDGMIAFRDARFADALASFPGPTLSGDRYWWTRDLVMRARLRARTGDAAGARDDLRALRPDDLARFRALRVEAAAAAALASVADRSTELAAELADATATLAALRQEFQTRDAQKQGKPIDVIVSSVMHGILDLASAYAGSGCPRPAVDTLSCMNGVEAWVIGYLRSDPHLESVRQDPASLELFEGWSKDAVRGFENFWKEPDDDPPSDGPPGGDPLAKE
jgi:hypothetical protein